MPRSMLLLLILIDSFLHIICICIFVFRGDNASRAVAPPLKQPTPAEIAAILGGVPGRRKRKIAPGATDLHSAEVMAVCMAEVSANAPVSGSTSIRSSFHREVFLPGAAATQKFKCPCPHCHADFKQSRRGRPMYNCFVSHFNNRDEANIQYQLWISDPSYVVNIMPFIRV